MITTFLNKIENATTIYKEDMVYNLLFDCNLEFKDAIKIIDFCLYGENQKSKKCILDIITPSCLVENMSPDYFYNKLYSLQSVFIANKKTDILFRKCLLYAIDLITLPTNNTIVYKEQLSIMFEIINNLTLLEYNEIDILGFRCTKDFYNYIDTCIENCLLNSEVGEKIKNCVIDIAGINEKSITSLNKMDRQDITTEFINANYIIENMILYMIKILVEDTDSYIIYNIQAYCLCSIINRLILFDTRNILDLSQISSKTELSAFINKYIRPRGYHILADKMMDIFIIFQLESEDLYYLCPYEKESITVSSYILSNVKK